VPGNRICSVCSGDRQGEAVQAAANHPDIRLFNVVAQLRSSTLRQACRMGGCTRICKDFSAAGYYFRRRREGTLSRRFDRFDQFVVRRLAGGSMDAGRISKCEIGAESDGRSN
jgi:hypothetical protein